MKTPMHFAAAATLALGLAATPALAENATLKVALADSAAMQAQPLAVMLDQPTGGAFVYLQEEGWKFSGRNAAAGNVDAPVPGAGQPVSLFVDGPTGFVFSYVVDKGWTYAGRVGGAE
ncbi:MAG: hypothetical protein RBS10_03220 [Thauera propionica]|nr:hypothetical protein [Thauera propionica]